MVWVCVCRVSAFWLRAIIIITVNFSVILSHFLSLWNEKISSAKTETKKHESMKQAYRADDVKTPSQKFKHKTLKWTLNHLHAV